MKKEYTLKLKIDLRKKGTTSEQIIDGIRNKILSREIPYGFEFNDFASIAKNSNILESDLIHACQVLVKQGFITYEDEKFSVRPISLTHNYYHHIIPLSEAIALAGYQASYQTVIQKKVSSIPEEIINDRSIEQTAWIFIRRVFYANDIPIIVLDTYLHEKDIEDDVDLSHVLFYEYLKAHTGKIATSSKRSIQAVKTPPFINEIFKHHQHTTIMKHLFTTYDQFNQPIEYGVGYASSNYSIITKGEIKVSL